MKNKYTEFLSTLSTEDLKRYVTNAQNYDPLAVEAAIEEFANRGQPIPNQQMDELRAEVLQDETLDTGIITDDASAGARRRLYSPGAIAAFSVVMSPLFGSILFVVNLVTLKRPQPIVPIISFGIGCTIGTFAIQGLLRNSSIALIWNGLGAALLYFGFWPRYIGWEQKYTLRAVWVPILVAIAVTAILLWVTFS